MTQTALGMTREIAGLAFEDAVQSVTATLKAEGFGVLTEIDVKRTLKEKIDVDFRPFTILGACNPKLSHQALEANPAFGLLMPCNVVVETIEDGVRISVADPAAMAQLADAPEVSEMAATAHDALRRALDNV